MRRARETAGPVARAQPVSALFTFYGLVNTNKARNRNRSFPMLTGLWEKLGREFISLHPLSLQEVDRKGPYEEVAFGQKPNR